MTDTLPFKKIYSMGLIFSKYTHTPSESISVILDDLTPDNTHNLLVITYKLKSVTDYRLHDKDFASYVIRLLLDYL